MDKGALPMKNEKSLAPTIPIQKNSKHHLKTRTRTRRDTILALFMSTPPSPPFFPLERPFVKVSRNSKLNSSREEVLLRIYN